MKIVLINSSPHSEEKSTSRFLAKKFVEGAQSAGHEIFIPTTWNSATWTFETLKNHYETLVCYMNWEDCGQVWAIGFGYRSAVEKSEFADAAFKIGANL